MFRRLFPRRAKLPPIDMARVGVDVHSHLIPGIDDGAPDMKTSIAIIKRMGEMGYEKLITTPHVMSDYFRNTKEAIKRGCEDVIKALDANGIDIQLEVAAEYYLDSFFLDLVEKKDILSFGDHYVLFELSFISEPIMLDEAIFRMQMAGYKPVLAHIERYNYWHRKPDKLASLADKGVLMQLNINSLAGYYGPQALKVARGVIENGMISLVGSDCHHDKHLDVTDDVRTLPLFHRLVDSGVLINTTL